MDSKSRATAGGGELTKFVCGYMACDANLTEVVLAALPSMFVVNIANDSAGQWLANSIQYSVREAGGPGTGSDVVIAKLSEVLSVETLRRFIRTCRTSRKVGWSARSGRRRSTCAAAQQAGAPLDHREPRPPGRCLAHAIRCALPSLSGRAADGISRTVAAQAGCGDTWYFRCQCRRDCGRGRLRVGSGVQPRIQAAIRISARPIPSIPYHGKQTK